MKRFSLLVLLVQALVLIVSCDDRPGQDTPDGLTPLLHPLLTVSEQTGTSFTIVWTPVENASGYTYEFMDQSLTVTDCELTFDNLESGTYTVRVRSDAPRHSEWTNSEFSEITVTLDGNIITVEAKNIAWNSARIVCSVNTGTAYMYDILDKEFYQTFTSDEEMVASYLEYVASQGVPVSMILKMGNDSTDLVGLIPETDYVVFAVGMDADGNMTSDVFTTEFTTDVMPPADAELSKWFGTWTAESAKTLRWTRDENGMPVSEVVDEPKTFEITIYGDPTNYEQALIDGWATCKDYPALARVDYLGNLSLYSAVVMDAADDRGLAPTWYPYARIDEGETVRYSLILGQNAVYSFEMDGDSASSEPLIGTQPSGSRFTTVAFDIFPYGDAGWTVYLDEEGNIPDMASGRITLTRKADAAETMPFHILRNY